MTLRKTLSQAGCIEDGSGNLCYEKEEIMERWESLMSHCIKLLLKIVFSRMKDTIRDEIGETQFGFHKGSGTREGIFTMRNIMERCIEVQKTIYIYASLIMKKHLIK